MLCCIIFKYWTFRNKDSTLIKYPWNAFQPFFCKVFNHTGWLFSPLVSLPYPSSCVNWDQLQSRWFFEGLNNSSMLLQVYPAPFNWVEIGPWWCRGEGKLVLSQPFSFIFFKVSSVGSSIEAKVANCASWMKIVLNTWANKRSLNFTVSEGTVHAECSKTSVLPLWEISSAWQDL